MSPQIARDYLEELSKKVAEKAYFSVPVERGIPLLVAYIVRVLNRTSHTEPYGFFEFINALFGRMDKVKRVEHKGFDDREFVKEVEKHFVVERTVGLFGPKWLGLNLGLGIVASPKRSG
jgi:hypothetical protein